MIIIIGWNIAVKLAKRQILRRLDTQKEGDNRILIGIIRMMG